MKRSVRAISIAVGLLIFGITVAFAEPITFEHRGTVNWVQDDPSAYSKVPASVGDLVIFMYTFQSDAINTADMSMQGY